MWVFRDCCFLCVCLHYPALIPLRRKSKIMSNRKTEIYSVSHQTTFPSAPNRGILSPSTAGPSTAGQLRRTRNTARPPRTSTASTTIHRMTRLARSNLPSCHSGLWLASTRARFSGSVSAVSESCLPGSMAPARSSRAILRYPTWIATTIVAQGGPGHVPLVDPPRVGSCGRLFLEQPRLGSQPQARWLAVTRRLRHACGW